MQAGRFRSSLLDQLENKGELTEGQMAVLWEKATLMEQMAQGELQLPPVGQKLTVKAVVRRVQRFNGVDVLRISFATEQGWTGVCETTDYVEHRLSENKEIWIEGTVRVAKEGWVAFRDLSRVTFQDPHR